MMHPVAMVSSKRGARVPPPPRSAHLEAAVLLLESAPGPAYLLETVRTGEAWAIVRANEAAGTVPARRLPGLAARILRCYHKPGPACPFEVRAFQDDCGRQLLLVAVERPVPEEAQPRIRRALDEWGLTRQQGRVLGLLARGYSNDEIADELGCAPKTVEHHVHAILGRTGAQSRAELVACFWTRLEVEPGEPPEQ